MLRVSNIGRVVLSATVVVIMVGCSGGSSASGENPSALVGRWVPKDVQEIPCCFSDKRLELLKDGTGILDGLSITWKTEGNRIYFAAMGQALASTYKLSGSTLILTDDDGDSDTLIKANQDKVAKAVKEDCGMYVRIIKESPVFVKTDPKSDIIRQVKKGECLELIARGFAWYQVEVDGKAGFLEPRACMVIR